MCEIKGERKAKKNKKSTTETGESNATERKFLFEQLNGGLSVESHKVSRQRCDLTLTTARKRRLKTEKRVKYF